MSEKNEWKSIDSAPKDGTEILAWREDCGKFIASYTSADAFPMTQDELDAWDEETLFAKDWFTQWPDATRLDGSEAPTLWQPLPVDPCPTCKDQGAVGNILNAQPCPDCSTPPASAQPERDWELTCDNCDGSGHVYVERQVAERKTDVQEFKEECECCEGRGFNIAFEDIPGIEGYVKSCRPATVAPGDAQDERQAFEAWGLKGCEMVDDPRCMRMDIAQHCAWEAWQARARIDAPAAGDALDAARYRWLRDPQTDVALVLDKRTGYVPEDESVPGVGGYHTYEYRAGEELDAAIDAALTAQVPHKGDAA